MRSYLDFEKPVAELEGKIDELRAMQASRRRASTSPTRSRGWRQRPRRRWATSTPTLTPWQKTQVARHPQRPHCLDYVSRPDHRIHAARRRPQIRRGRGDRRRLRPLPRRSICVIGQEKGSDTESRLKHNFGMARPEGYRKAVRLMEMADRFGIPVLALVDTAGAYPGIGAEERGQAEAIARSTETCLELGVPNVAVIIGEGGSGGAIAIATANRVLMLEHAIYTVISPEGAASILWRDTTKAQEAATNMKITAQDLQHSASSTASSPSRSAARTATPPPPSPPPARPSAAAFAELESLDREQSARSAAKSSSPSAATL